MMECRFSWQAQHLVNIWAIAGMRNVVFLQSKSVLKARRVSSANGWVVDAHFILGSRSERSRSSFPLVGTIHEFQVSRWKSTFRGVRNFLVMLKAGSFCSALYWTFHALGRCANVMCRGRRNLVMSEGNFGCSAHCEGCLMCYDYQT